jgi:hypothetical protein
MAGRFAAALKYADNFWFRPCDDNVVHTNHGPINVTLEMHKLSMDDGNWQSAFLIYTSLRRGDNNDGLYFIPSSISQHLIANHNSSRFGYGDRSGTVDFIAFPRRKFICSWDDIGGPDTEMLPGGPGQKAIYSGLNDCAHFLTSCLAAQGIKLGNRINVPKVVTELRARSDVKTLAYLVESAKADRIVKSDLSDPNNSLMKPGDVIFYGSSSEQHHSALFVGSGKTREGIVATHTFSNHKPMSDLNPSLNWKSYIFAHDSAGHEREEPTSTSCERSNHSLPTPGSSVRT